MHATIRRYEGVDTKRTEELSRKVSETLVPELQKLEGFSGYYLIESGDGVFSSVGLFKGFPQSDEATKIAAAWVKDEKLESALPNPPKVTSGKVIVHQNGVSVD
jgi:hypothetical protein